MLLLYSSTDGVYFIHSSIYKNIKPLLCFWSNLSLFLINISFIISLDSICCFIFFPPMLMNCIGLKFFFLKMLFAIFWCQGYAGLIKKLGSVHLFFFFFVLCKSLRLIIFFFVLQDSSEHVVLFLREGFLITDLTF